MNQTTLHYLYDPLCAWCYSVAPLVRAALSSNLAVMAVARFLPALGLPVFWTLASEAGRRLLGPGRAGKAVSMINFGIVTAAIFGIPLGTLVSDRFGWRVAFAALAVLALIKAGLLYVFLPTLPGGGERVPVWRQLAILRAPEVSGHVGLSFLV